MKQRYKKKLQIIVIYFGLHSKVTYICIVRNKQTEIMTANQFQTGQKYGNDLTVEIVSRTEKTVTIKTVAWGTKRVKLRNYNGCQEAIYFKAWIITSDEIFDADEAAYNSMYKSYYC